MIKSLAGLKRALQPGAVVTMMAWEGHPNGDLIGVPRTVVSADAEKVGFDTSTQCWGIYHYAVEG
jgi:hypothetical protein